MQIFWFFICACRNIIEKNKLKSQLPLLSIISEQKSKQFSEVAKLNNDCKDLELTSKFVLLTINQSIRLYQIDFSSMSEPLFFIHLKIEVFLVLPIMLLVSSAAWPPMHLQLG